MKINLLLLRLSIFLLLPLSGSETYSPGDFLSALTVTDTKKDPLWEITGAASIGLAQGTTTDFRHSPLIKKTKTKGTLAPIFSTRKTTALLPPTASEFSANTTTLLAINGSLEPSAHFSTTKSPTLTTASILESHSATTFLKTIRPSSHSKPAPVTLGKTKTN
jgi:hypothetical protein